MAFKHIGQYWCFPRSCAHHFSLGPLYNEVDFSKALRARWPDWVQPDVFWRLAVRAMEGDYQMKFQQLRTPRLDHLSCTSWRNYIRWLTDIQVFRLLCSSWPGREATDTLRHSVLLEGLGGRSHL